MKARTRAPALDVVLVGPRLTGEPDRTGGLRSGHCLRAVPQRRRSAAERPRQPAKDAPPTGAIGIIALGAGVYTFSGFTYEAP